MRKRRYFTQSEMEEVWDRCENGESLNSIARGLERGHSAVQGMLSRTGGIRPAPKRRSGLALTLAEREEISRGIASGLSIRAIAAQLVRAPSTISREINRNGGRRRYRANQADEAAWQRAHPPKTCKLAQNPAAARLVAGKLMKRWSPRQIAGWLKRTFPNDESFQVSHETIYLTLYIQARGALKKQLIKYLRAAAPCAARATTRRRAPIMAESSMPCRSVNGRPRSRIARSLATGKVIFCSAATTARSPH